MEWDSYNGHLEATESVSVTARVGGMITATPFAEGSLVKKSQVLFVLDDRPFKADLASKVAEQDKAIAQVTSTRLSYERLDRVRSQGSVSSQEYEAARADFAKAEAEVAVAKAAVELSRLNLEWCQVTAPIDGRVGRRMVTVGNMVGGGAGSATPLTTIQSVDPIGCTFEIDERSALKYQTLSADKKRTHERDGQVPCHVRLGHQADYPHAGFVDFVDNRVDPATGTLRARVRLQNPAGLLTPGCYAHLRIPGSGRYTALLVPDAALGNDQSHRTVLAVNKDNVVEVRKVQVGALFGDLRSITSGLSPDDRVVINGQMRAYPGAPVVPTEAPLTVDSSGAAKLGTGTPGGSDTGPALQVKTQLAPGGVP